MIRPMSPLERSLLYPAPEQLTAEKLAEMEAERCPVCTGLTGFWAGKLDMPCVCPKPEPPPRPNIPCGPLRGDEIARAPDGGPLLSVEMEAEWRPPRRLTESERLCAGLAMLGEQLIEEHQD